MFVLLLSYTKPREVEALVPDHRAWLREHHAAGRFLVSGQRVPIEAGGAILARGDDRDEVEAIAASDPFVRGGVAEYEVVQFRASQMAPGFDAFV